MTDFIRASSLPGYSDCARRAATRLFRRDIESAGYVLAETPRGIGATIGTSVHAAAALTLTEKAKTGSPAPLTTVTDCAVQAYRTESADGLLFDTMTTSAAEAERQVVGMAREYQNAILPQITPVAVEEQLEAETPFGLVLTGRSDILAREDGGRLRDLKTSKRRGSHRAQIGSYTLLAKANGFEVATACEDWIQRGSAKKPQAPARTFEHDVLSAESTTMNVLRHIAHDIAVFREGDEHTLPGDPAAFLANPSSILCSAKFCPAWGSDWCREHMTQEAE